MKRTLSSLWRVWLPLVLVGCQTSTAGTQRDLLATLTGVAGFKVSRFPEMESRYPNTECVQLRRDDLSVGFVCRSRNKEFIADMGVVPSDTLPASVHESAAGSGDVYAVTPMAQYKMVTLPSAPQGVVAAVVDCDSQNSEVYRATASCHLAVTPPGQPTVLFSNVLVEDYVTKRKGLSAGEIANVWKRLR